MIVERAMPLGGAVTIDGEDVTYELALKSYGSSKATHEFVLIAPIDSDDETFFCINDHFAFDEEKKYFYVPSFKRSGYGISSMYMNKGDGWVSISPIPNTAIKSSDDVSYLAVNNQLHVFYYTNHYMYDVDSDTWTTMTTLPISIKYINSALYHNGAIHIFNTTNGIYKWDGSSWSNVISTMSGARLLSYKNEFISLGYYQSEPRAYKLIDGAWTQIENVTNFKMGTTSLAFVEGDKLYTAYVKSSGNYYINIYDGTTIIAKEMNTSETFSCNFMLIIGGDVFFWTNLNKLIKCGAQEVFFKSIYFPEQNGTKYYF